MHRRMKNAVVGVVGMAAMIAAGGAVASDAYAYTSQRIGGNECYSLNPNILDFPAYSGVNIISDGSGTFTINGDSKSFFPYTSNTTVQVTSLSTKVTKTYKRHWVHNIGDNSGFFINDIPGKGRVRVTVTGTNHGLIPSLPGARCSGVVTV